MPADRHKQQPLSFRLPEAERLALYEAAAREGIPVRQWLITAIRERLERGRAQCPGSETR